jgi:NAD(P)-dependent dehydrogenase (short-subunit alcohol dehydrogenase family)
MNPAGKVALVTGGAVRVGKALTLALARAGAHVVIDYHSSAQAAQATAQEAAALGVRALAVQADVSDPGAVQRLAAEAQAAFGGVDILVNAADHFARTPFPSQDASVFADWQRATRVALDGAWLVCNAFAPGMVARGAGLIVNIVDLSAWQPWRGFAAHGVAKAGLLALTRQLALELAPAVRVNAIAPGNVLPPPGTTPERAASLARRSLLGRWGSPDDVARALLYLVEADFVTGDVLTVDGGERLKS